MSTQPKSYLTPEQYLEIERQAEIKSEYYAGEMFAMSGGTGPHSLIKIEVGYLLRSRSLGRFCRVYDSDMRIQVSATGLYTYPDISVVCGPVQYADGRLDVLLNPCLILEVLSPSTEAYDRGRKFHHYRTIPSLLQYVLVATDRVQADVLTRKEDGVWVISPADQPDDELDLGSVGCKLRLGDLYAQTDLLQEPPSA